MFSYRKALALIVVGLVIVLGGLAYDVMYAGIPYQDDPGPALARAYAENSAFAGRICSTGQWVFVAGTLWLLAAFVVRRLRRPSKLPL